MSLERSNIMAGALGVLLSAQAISCDASNSEPSAKSVANEGVGQLAREAAVDCDAWPKTPSIRLLATSDRFHARAREILDISRDQTDKRDCVTDLAETHSGLLSNGCSVKFSTPTGWAEPGLEDTFPIVAEVDCPRL